MAMPGSGPISMTNVWNEHFWDTGNSGTNVPSTYMGFEDWHKSAKGTAGGNYATWDRTANMTEGAPYAMSEFHGAYKTFEE